MAAALAEPECEPEDAALDACTEAAGELEALAATPGTQPGC